METQELPISPKFSAQNHFMKQSQKPQSMIEIFEQFDSDNDGKISANDIKALWESVGEYLSPEAAQNLIKNLDNDGDKLIDFQGFLRLTEAKSDDQAIKEAFELFESEKGSGRITPKSLNRTLSHLGESSPYGDTVSMIKAFKTGEDWKLDYDEFYRMMMTNSIKRKLINLNLNDARKLLRISKLEMVKSKLKQMKQEYIAYSEFINICSDACSHDLGLEFAKILDDSGTVIVLGEIVLLQPHQLVRAIQGLIPLNLANPTDERVMELEEMEKLKAAIDKKAEWLVRRELWCWLGYLVIQTAVVVMLAFKKLSWNVMEPICYCIAYVYVIARMCFFLWTSTEPSLKGFFESRSASKQRRLMKVQNFHVERYNELKRVCSSSSSSAPSWETAITISDSLFSEDNDSQRKKKE
ncbi:hypothetical protein ACH5RR_014145 [Cinchona calisaya]|uniref:EF-hand domain-containing protein n=1 Tax=Cinchona calisaya TaxID=153742 RepID=A0ABD3A3K4_9GENT